MATNNKKLNILVTGGKGFLGAHLIRLLQERGHNVESFDIINGQDLRDYDAVEKAVRGKDVVYHLAAVADLNYAREHPRETMDVNIGGTINIAEACTKYKAILHFASTCCVYGNPDTHPVDETTYPKPTEIYAHSKLAGEHIILGYASHFGLECILLRLATFYGRDMRAALAPFLFLKLAMRGEPITIHGSGNQTRTFTHVRDIVDGMVRVLDRGIENEIINITTEEEVSVIKMAKLAKDLTGSDSKIIFVPDRPGQIYKESIKADKARKLLDWEAKIKFKEGMRELFSWMKGQYP